jgi:hypothetical protein
MTDGGKGSKQRPKQITDEQLAANWERIFGVPTLHGDAQADGPQDGPCPLQEADPPTTGP